MFIVEFYFEQHSHTDDHHVELFKHHNKSIVKYINLYIIDGKLLTKIYG